MDENEEDVIELHVVCSDPQNDVENPVFLGKWNPKLDKIFWHPSRINEINLTKK